MSQITIPAVPMTVGFAGMKSDNGDDDIKSYVQAESSAEMPPGVMLMKGTGDRDAKLPDAETALLIGVLGHTMSWAPSELGSTGVKPKASLPVVREGRRFVITEDAVVPGQRAYVRFAGTGQKGAFRGTAVVGETIDVTGQVAFLTTADAGALVEVEIDMKNLS